MKAGRILLAEDSAQDVELTLNALAEQRLRRMYAALSAAHEAILKIEDPPTLYRRVCELLIDHGGLKLAAVRLVDLQTRWIETVAHAGEAAGYLEAARIPASAQVPDVQGPTRQAITEGRTVVSNDYLALTAMSSDFYWQTDAEHRFTLRESGARPRSAATFAVDGWRGKTRVGTDTTARRAAQ